MIRSSKLSIKFANKNKKDNINLFIEEYKNITQCFIDKLWELDKIPVLVPKEITSQVETWLSARAIQCSAKQASGIVRGTKKKNEQRQYIYNKLIEQKLYKKARKLKTIIDKNNSNKPQINSIQPELDSRFVKFNFDNKTSFDGWITLICLGNKFKIKIPVKKTKHFNSLTGMIKSGIRISNNKITFMFEEEIKTKEIGEIIGLDIGIKNIATLSDNQSTKTDVHGWNLSKIIQRINRKKKGSKGYLKVQRHRTNFINWSINQLNLNNVKTLKLEKIKDVRRGVQTSKYLNRWTYTEIKSKLELTCEKLGVQVEYVNPTYTSQRCSSCGWVRSDNRKDKEFKCSQCNFSLDADLNASRNIVANLRPIGVKERLLHKNKTGFYWNEIKQECIVPVTQIS